MKSTKRWLAVAAAAFTSGVVLLNLLAFRHAYAMTHYTTGSPRTGKPETLTFGQKLGVLFCGISLPRPEASVPLDPLGLPGRALDISCTNGIRLGAWYSPAEESNALVLLFHGYGGDKGALLREAVAFREIGFSVLLIDFRGSGASSASSTTIGYLEAEDVAESTRYAREHLAPSRVILYGQSMGAAAILRAVHSCGVRPDAIIAEAVFDTMLHTVCNRFRAMNLVPFPAAHVLVFWGGCQSGFNGFRHNPRDYASRVECPILFLHGEADPRARLEEARQVYAGVPGVKTFHSFPGIGHEPCLARFPGKWRKQVGEFLRAFLEHSQ